jgi:hypothetical protein
MKRVMKILMERDGESREDAIELVKNFKKELEQLIEDKGSLDDAEELVELHFGLEPDYLEEFLLV